MGTAPPLASEPIARIEAGDDGLNPDVITATLPAVASAVDNLPRIKIVLPTTSIEKSYPGCAAHPFTRAGAALGIEEYKPDELFTPETLSTLKP